MREPMYRIETSLEPLSQEQLNTYGELYGYELVQMYRTGWWPFRRHAYIFKKMSKAKRELYAVVDD